MNDVQATKLVLSLLQTANEGMLFAPVQRTKAECICRTEKPKKKMLRETGEYSETKGRYSLHSFHLGTLYWSSKGVLSTVFSLLMSSVGQFNTSEKVTSVLTAIKRHEGYVSSKERDGCKFLVLSSKLDT